MNQPIKNPDIRFQPRLEFDLRGGKLLIWKYRFTAIIEQSFVLDRDWGFCMPACAYDQRVGWAILLPLWLPLAGFALPTIWLWCRPGYRRHKGHCPTCNYNLTGNQSGICSECGTKIVESKAGSTQGA